METLSRNSVKNSDSFDPEEIRRIVQVGKARGLIHAPGTKVEIKRGGLCAVALDKVKSQWLDVTPEMARHWLKNNFGNRPLKQEVVDAYARDMITGVWTTTHQGIAFNDADELIDGQHRLKAIIRSGCTVRVMVTFGLPGQIKGKEMTTMDAVDRGATRSVADQLTIQHGIKHGGQIARLCSSLGGICFGERTRRLSVGQTLEIFRAFESAVLYVVTNASKKPGLRAVGVSAGFALALMTEERFWETETPISDMFAALMTGEKMVAGSAIKQMHEFLTGPESLLFTRTMDRGMAEMVLQAIHLDSQGKTNQKLEAVPDGAIHFKALQPERVKKVAALFELPKA